MSAEFPDKLRFLFKPARYKVVRGGRGSSKSWGFARALLILGASKKLRILCTREVQKSIKDSVHKLLTDQIQLLGLGAHYKVLETEIRGINGTEFLFAGLSTQTIESIKSFEGIDICWVEEGQGVTKRSWTILVPTIRKEASEIWCSFNPDLDDDETYIRFVINPPPDCVSIEMNYHDNPWFPEVLEKERAHAERSMAKDEYENIWLGKCKAAVDGAIYANEIRDAVENKRICNVPYDAKFKTYAVFDLGWNDQTSIIIAQRHLSELRVIDYIEDSHRTLDWYSAELRNRHYNWGRVFLPHDATHATLNAGGKSSADIMKSLKWDVGMVPNMAIETGIKQARMAFNKVYFDKTKADRLIQCLKRYKRNIPVSTGEPASPVHDEYSHGADCFRYLSLIASQMSNEDWKPIQYSNKGII